MLSIRRRYRGFLVIRRLARAHAASRVAAPRSRLALLPGGCRSPRDIAIAPPAPIPTMPPIAWSSLGGTFASRTNPMPVPSLASRARPWPSPGPRLTPRFRPYALSPFKPGGIVHEFPFAVKEKKRRRPGGGTAPPGRSAAPPPRVEGRLTRGSPSQNEEGMGHQMIPVDREPAHDETYHR